MVQRGASPRAAATAYGIGQHHMRRLIREGSVTPRAIGRRSIVLFSELSSRTTTARPLALRRLQRQARAALPTLAANRHDREASI